MDSALALGMALGSEVAPEMRLAMALGMALDLEVALEMALGMALDSEVAPEMALGMALDLEVAMVKGKEVEELARLSHGAPKLHCACQRNDRVDHTQQRNSALCRMRSPLPPMQFPMS